MDSISQDLLKIVQSMEEDNDRFNFFLKACEIGSLSICQICLDAGIDINIVKRPYRQTLLIKLVEDGHFTTEIADWLIERGANMDIGNITDYTALSEACCKGNFEAAEYFIKKGAEIQKEDLLRAVAGKNCGIVEMLLESGIDLDETSVFKSSNPLIEAIEYRTHSIVELFSRKYATINFYVEGRTPLHWAALSNRTDIVRILLEHGADANVRVEPDDAFDRNDFFITPMDIAIFKKNEEMQKLLKKFNGLASTKKEKIEFLKKCSPYDKEKVYKAVKKL